MRGLPLACGETPWVSRWELSLDLSTLDAALDTIRRSPQSPHSSNFLRQSVSISSLQQLLTPERLLFFTPATSYARASLFLHSSNFLRPSVFISSVVAFQRFLLFSLFLVVWMMLSPYSPSSFTLQSPDCSGIYLPDACIHRLHGNHFLQVSS